MRQGCFLLLLLCSCSTSIYKAVNEKNFDLENNKAVFRKLIFLSNKRFSESDYLVKVINRQDWHALDAYQRKYSVDENNTMLRSIRSLIERQYLQSSQYLNALPDSSFNSQVLVMKTDCLHELHADSVNYYKRYQLVFDQSDNKYIKGIAQKRFRFYTHGY